jgi:hypothetical protein
MEYHNMQKDEFIKIVNAMIDARIKKMVPTLIKKHLSEYKNEILRELKEGTAELPESIEMGDLSSVLKEADAMLQEDIVFPPKTSAPASRPVRVTKNYSKDPKLNAILQQTEQEIRAGKTQPAADAEYMSQYKQLLAEQYAKAAANGEDMETFSFNTSNMSDIAGKRAMVPPNVKSEIEKKVALEIEKKQIEAVTGNAELGGLIMRDYRSLMKAVDEKAKQKRGA